jgi:hypothetical protein
MRGQERKIATLVVSGLLVAITCFGLLESSGAIENPGYKFGGAFAGFLITLVFLNRFGGPDSFEDQVARSGAEVAYEEIVKVLDLRLAPPRSTPGRCATGPRRLRHRRRRDARRRALPCIAANADQAPRRLASRAHC